MFLIIDKNQGSLIALNDIKLFFFYRYIFLFFKKEL